MSEKERKKAGLHKKISSIFKGAPILQIDGDSYWAKEARENNAKHKRTTRRRTVNKKTAKKTK